ncbi:MAG: DUF4417 domain-containing protein [Eubacteriaceae bacterium]|nr:DUF4417 domain-containing protein [Eubacteriaceae bacterium]
MRKLTKKAVGPDGKVTRTPVKLSGKLNFNIADYLNQSFLNEYNLPIHHCDPDVYPDFIALNCEPAKYHETPLTAVAFYTYDKSFDKIDGLFNAIYYDDKRLLAKYERQYKDVAFVIAPDYSMFDDIWQFENNYRLFKTRILMLWFVLVIKAVVIPNVPYLDTSKLPLYLSGFEKCTVMCFSTKSHVRYKDDRKRIRDNVKYTVDTFPLKTILVYSVCGRDSTSLELFDYALSKGIDVRIIDNTMRRQNQRKLRKEATA